MESSTQPRANETPPFHALVHHLTADLLLSASEAHLLILLPVILFQLLPPHISDHSAKFFLPLQQRISSSRRLKLRVLLLRAHPVFRNVPVNLRYSSHAYVKPLVSTALSMSSSRLDIFSEHGPRELAILVDMVGTRVPFSFVCEDEACRNGIVTSM